MHTSGNLVTNQPKNIVVDTTDWLLWEMYFDTAQANYISQLKLQL